MSVNKPCIVGARTITDESAEFGRYIEYLMQERVRPIGDPRQGKEWAPKELSGKLHYKTKKVISLWCEGKTVPPQIDHLVKAFFGEKPFLGESSERRTMRERLCELHKLARESKMAPVTNRKAKPKLGAVQAVEPHVAPKSAISESLWDSETLDISLFLGVTVKIDGKILLSPKYLELFRAVCGNEKFINEIVSLDSSDVENSVTMQFIIAVLAQSLARRSEISIAIVINMARGIIEILHEIAKKIGVMELVDRHYRVGRDAFDTLGAIVVADLPNPSQDEIQKKAFEGWKRIVSAALRERPELGFYEDIIALFMFAVVCDAGFVGWVSEACAAD